MSADAITTCPSCGEDELREFYEWYSDADLARGRSEDPSMPTEVTANYSCSCRQCGYQDEFEHTHPYKVQVPTDG